MNESSGFDWYVDQCDLTRIRGWIIDLRNRVPVEVMFVSEGRRLFQLTAGISRLDVQLAGKGAEFCGIEVSFDPSLWNRIRTLDVVLPDGSIIASLNETNYVSVSAADKVIVPRPNSGNPLRIKVYIPGDGGMRPSLYKSLVLAYWDDNRWADQLLLPASSKPYYVVVHDRYVFEVVSNSFPDIDGDSRAVVPLTELTHLHLAPDDTSGGSNYAVYAGELFQLPNGITICQNVRISKL